MTTTTIVDDTAAPTAPRPPAFRDAVAAEWMKLRTVRTTYALLAGAAAATLLGLTVLALLVQDYDRAAPAERAAFEAADPTVAVMPFVGFLIGSIGAMVITSEYTTGSIGPGLLAVPQRGLLLGAKATVAATVGAIGGLLFALLSCVGTIVLLGDRPAPLNPWPTWTDAVPTVVGAALVVLTTSAVALGLGAVLRSTAATLVTLGGLGLVVPMFAHALPTTLHLLLASILIPNLAPQLAGADHPYLLSPVGAAAAAVVWVVAALAAGAFALDRRDAG
ncbi:ABC transporter permease [Pseudonocardia humida]|uniref:ABC transporter permease n=1 Tax=Pseudonocardia humida TaxID=2800819 RepID=A0ABT0ZVR3_9PSEU|nr:ABC transporter permease [Pseudonocardia humida]MCO1654833.1 ABC transporter permease [Pseudonocardia humida]